MTLDPESSEIQIKLKWNRPKKYQKVRKRGQKNHCDCPHRVGSNHDESDEC